MTFAEFVKERAARSGAMRPPAAPGKTRPWQVGFGPFMNVAPGETRSVDAQPKCLFKSKNIFNTGDAEDVHLLAIYIGGEEQLKLKDGETIPFSELEPLTLAEDFRTSDPAFTMQIEFQNRSKEPRTISLAINGDTTL